MIKDSKLKQQRYQPEFSYTKPKSTPGGQFVIKSTGDEYRGTYFETSDGKYYSGTRPEDNGVELEKITAEYLEDLMPLVPAVLALLKGFFKPKPTNANKQAGKLTRYFIKPKSKNKIQEVDLPTYIQAKSELQNYVFAQTDWIIKGPAENQIINGYPYEGAASKNRKAIQALEKTIPGISTFITDYSLLVEELAVISDTSLQSATTVVEDPQTQLDNSRKANFDLRK